MDHNRSQTGVGTMMVFIAMILVAAIAAGVLINVTGLLEQEATTSFEDSTSQVTDRLLILSVTGRVSDTDTVDVYNFTVARSPGANDIALENATFEIVDSQGAETYVVGNVSEEPTREVREITAETNDTVITQKSDRYIISIDASERDGELRPGESATVTYTTGAGAATTVDIRAPESLTEKSVAKLYRPSI